MIGKTSEDSFEKREILGNGSYGEVYKVFDKRNGGNYAAKIIHNHEDFDSMRKEISILRECDHPNIIKYISHFQTHNELWLILEICELGSVADIMFSTKKCLNEYQLSTVIYDILKGLDYLHSKKIIHRDIKASNILLDRKGNSKIADFGVAIYSSEKESSVLGTPFWMSPEIISKKKYSKKTDIWSLGITAIEMAEGAPPFADENPIKAMFIIKKNPAQNLTNPSKWSIEFNRFVKDCLNISQKDRKNAKELIQNDFIQNKKKKSSLLEFLHPKILEMEHLKRKPSRIMTEESNEQKSKLDTDKLSLHRQVQELLKQRDIEILRIKEKYDRKIARIQRKLEDQEKKPPKNTSSSRYNDKQNSCDRPHIRSKDSSVEHSRLLEKDNSKNNIRKIKVENIKDRFLEVKPDQLGNDSKFYRHSFENESEMRRNKWKSGNICLFKDRLEESLSPSDLKEKIISAQTFGGVSKKKIEFINRKSYLQKNNFKRKLENKENIVMNEDNPFVNNLASWKSQLRK